MFFVFCSGEYPLNIQCITSSYIVRGEYLLKIQCITYSYIVRGEYPLKMRFIYLSVLNTDWKLHVLRIQQSLGLAHISHKDKSSQSSNAAMPKHDASFERQFLWITTPKREGTFGGVVRELTHVIFGADFASAAVTERRQGGS